MLRRASQRRRGPVSGSSYGPSPRAYRNMNGSRLATGQPSGESVTSPEHDRQAVQQRLRQLKHAPVRDYGYRRVYGCGLVHDSSNRLGCFTHGRELLSDLGLDHAPGRESDLKAIGLRAKKEPNPGPTETQPVRYSFEHLKLRNPSPRLESSALSSAMLVPRLSLEPARLFPPEQLFFGWGLRAT